MSRRDRLFMGAVLGLTALVAVPLAAFPPIDEPHAALGAVAGWGLALLIMVPSYLLLLRAVGEDNPHRFVSAFMTGSILRLFLTLAGVLVFRFAVEPAPMRSFLLAYLGGYVLLSAVELRLTHRPRASAAPTRVLP